MRGTVLTTHSGKFSIACLVLMAVAYLIPGISWPHIGLMQEPPDLKSRVCTIELPIRAQISYRPREQPRQRQRPPQTHRNLMPPLRAVLKNRRPRRRIRATALPGRPKLRWHETRIALREKWAASDHDGNVVYEGDIGTGVLRSLDRVQGDINQKKRSSTSPARTRGVWR